MCVCLYIVHSFNFKYIEGMMYIEGVMNIEQRCVCVCVQLDIAIEQKREKMGGTCASYRSFNTAYAKALILIRHISSRQQVFSDNDNNNR